MFLIEEDLDDFLQIVNEGVLYSIYGTLTAKKLLHLTRPWVISLRLQFKLSKGKQSDNGTTNMFDRLNIDANSQMDEDDAKLVSHLSYDEPPLDTQTVTHYSAPNNPNSKKADSKPAPDDR